MISMSGETGWRLLTTNSSSLTESLQTRLLYWVTQRLLDSLQQSPLTAVYVINQLQHATATTSIS